VVEADKVGFSYGRRAVLQGLSLQIAPGEVFGVLGAFALALLAAAMATVRRA
jgi:ABC-type transporter Mla maintaining outer membrane lipid asymmetry ATPase subunit MlaF